MAAAVAAAALSYLLYLDTITRSGWMVVEDKMQSLISGLGGKEWVEGKISWRWNYCEIGVPVDRVCEGTIEKISFGLVRVRGGLGEKG